MKPGSIDASFVITGKFNLYCTDIRLKLLNFYLQSEPKQHFKDACHSGPSTEQELWLRHVLLQDRKTGRSKPPYENCSQIHKLFN